MSPAKKLLVVVGIQLLILLSVIGFKQYTVLTSDTMLLRITSPADPTGLRGGDALVRYEISTIDLANIGGETPSQGHVYVELQRGDDGYWRAVGVHERRERTFGGTVLLEGNVQAYSRGRTISVRYGTERVFVPEGSQAGLPAGAGHTIGVETKVDRFGNADPQRFIIDGQPFDLARR